MYGSSGKRLSFGAGAGSTPQSARGVHKSGSTGRGRGSEPRQRKTPRASSRWGAKVLQTPVTAATTPPDAPLEDDSQEQSITTITDESTLGADRSTGVFGTPEEAAKHAQLLMAQAKEILKGINQSTPPPMQPPQKVRFESNESNEHVTSPEHDPEDEETGTIPAAAVGNGADEANTSDTSTPPSDLGLPLVLDGNYDVLANETREDRYATYRCSPSELINKPNLQGFNNMSYWYYAFVLVVLDSDVNSKVIHVVNKAKTMLNHVIKNNPGWEDIWYFLDQSESAIKRLANTSRSMRAHLLIIRDISRIYLQMDNLSKSLHTCLLEVTQPKSTSDYLKDLTESLRAYSAADNVMTPSRSTTPTASLTGQVLQLKALQLKSDNPTWTDVKLAIAANLATHQNGFNLGQAIKKGDRTEIQDAVHQLQQLTGPGFDQYIHMVKTTISTGLGKYHKHLDRQEVLDKPFTEFLTLWEDQFNSEPETWDRLAKNFQKVFCLDISEGSDSTITKALDLIPDIQLDWSSLKHDLGPCPMFIIRLFLLKRITNSKILPMNDELHDWLKTKRTAQEIDKYLEDYMFKVKAKASALDMDLDQHAHIRRSVSVDDKDEKSTKIKYMTLEEVPGWEEHAKANKNLSYGIFKQMSTAAQKAFRAERRRLLSEGDGKEKEKSSPNKKRRGNRTRDGTKDDKNGSEKDSPGRDLLSDEAKLEQMVLKLIKKSLSSQEGSGATAI